MEIAKITQILASAQTHTQNNEDTPQKDAADAVRSRIKAADAVRVHRCTDVGARRDSRLGDVMARWWKEREGEKKKVTDA